MQLWSPVGIPWFLLKASCVREEEQITFVPARPAARFQLRYLFLPPLLLALSTTSWAGQVQNVIPVRDWYIRVVERQPASDSLSVASSEVVCRTASIYCRPRSKTQRIVRTSIGVTPRNNKTNLSVRRQRCCYTTSASCCAPWRCRVAPGNPQSPSKLQIKVPPKFSFSFLFRFANSKQPMSPGGDCHAFFRHVLFYRSAKPPQSSVPRQTNGAC